MQDKTSKRQLSLREPLQGYRLLNDQRISIFDLEVTMESGQTPTFTWEKTGTQKYNRISGGQELWLEENRLRTKGLTDRQTRKLFRLQDDVEKIYAMLSEADPVLYEATSQFNGLRLTQTDPWETTVCFIVSQNNNLKRIKSIIRRMHQNRLEGAESIAYADLSFLGLGYREKYLKETARQVAENGFSLERLKWLPWMEAREALCELPGVGPKVADCILLYGLGKTEAFPVDVWVRKAMASWYDKNTEKQIESFAHEQWGKNAGYAQQLLFCKARAEL